MEIRIQFLVDLLPGVFQLLVVGSFGFRGQFGLAVNDDRVAKVDFYSFSLQDPFKSKRSLVDSRQQGPAGHSGDNQAPDLREAECRVPDGNMIKDRPSDFKLDRDLDNGRTWMLPVDREGVGIV